MQSRRESPAVVALRNLRDDRGFNKLGHTGSRTWEPLCVQGRHGAAYGRPAPQGDRDAPGTGQGM